LKLARLIFLQPILALLAIGWIIQTQPQSSFSSYETDVLPAAQALPAAGDLITVSPVAPETGIPTLMPVIPTSLPELDAQAFAASLAMPDMVEFLERISPAEPDQVVGVFSPDRLALLVEQQPPNHSLYVTDKAGYATQFSRPARYDVIGLLAHNTHSGILFYELDLGSPVYLAFGDGAVSLYRVEDIQDFQKLEPWNSRSDYVELSSGQVLGTNAVYDRFYRNGHHLILQTCLEFEGDFNWGVRFILARPVDMAKR
jgi:hypothetical protein